jgi:predicted flap endonuclease-1-like 5' DNA nuclease
MIYLLSKITGWLIAAGLVGTVTGWLTFSKARRERTPWLRWAALAFVVALFAVLVRGLPCKAGLWLEELVLFSVVYVLGCLLGGWLKSKVTGSPVVVVEPPASPMFVPAQAETAVAPVLSIDPASQHRPAGLVQPSEPFDNLILIRGIGPKNQMICNELGIYHFSQIASWTPQNASWVGNHMRFPGRIQREQWIEQARLLAAGLDTDHSAGVKSGTISIDEHADEPLSDAEAESLRGSFPALSPPLEGEDAHGGTRPLGLAGAKGGAADDLKRIKGIGRQNEERLNGLGVWHFEQIAAWSPDNVKWVGSYLAFPGRIDREQWVTQAVELAAGRSTEFSTRVQAGEVATSRSDPSA